MKITYDINRCKEALAEQGKSQKDLADKTLSASAISKFFRGKTVSHARTAAPIIRKLGLSLVPGKDAVLKITHDRRTNGTQNRKTA